MIGTIVARPSMTQAMAEFVVPKSMPQISSQDDARAANESIKRAREEEEEEGEEYDRDDDFVSDLRSFLIDLQFW